MKIEAILDACRPDCEQERQDLRLMRLYLSKFDDLLLRTNEMAHFTASSWIVSPDRERVLMAYHNIYQSWSWTGGHADGDGDLLAVALREAREETAVQRVSPVLERPLSAEILTVPAHWKRGAYVAAHLHLNVTYLLEADDRQPLAVKPDENSDVRWFSLDEAVAASTEPEMRIVYQKLNGKLWALRS